MIYTKITEYKNKVNEARFKGTSKEDSDKRAEEMKNTKQSTLKYHVDKPSKDDITGLTKYKSTPNTTWLEMKLETHEPFFVLGHAGWGKTSIIKQVANSMGLTVVTVYLDKALPEDLGGIPIATKSGDDNTYVDNALPKWAQYIYDHPQDDFLVFFDEMNQASPQVQNALMPILLESTIAGIKFNNIWFGAAGNFSEENVTVSNLSDPLRKRFTKEKKWREKWEDTFDHLKQKYSNKISENLLSLIFNNNITDNPRSLEKLLNSVVKFKNSHQTYSIDDLHNYFSDFNDTDKDAEVKLISEKVFEYLNSENTIDPAKKSKKSNVKRAVMTSADVNHFVSMINRGSYIADTGDVIDVNKDNFAQVFDLTPEEAELIKQKL